MEYLTILLNYLWQIWSKQIGLLNINMVNIFTNLSFLEKSNLSKYFINTLIFLFQLLDSFVFLKEKSVG